MSGTPRRWLRDRVRTGPIIVVPGAANALTARLIEDAGFEAIYVSGAGIANTFLGAPDVGLVTLTELTAHVSAIRDAVSLPLIVDADTGYGNQIGVGRTVRMLEQAGADAIQLEDQIFPKRCGHFDGKELIGQDEMEQKVRAAVDARTDDDVLIIARTDARAVEGFDRAVERARAYLTAGADVSFVESPQSAEEVRRLPGLLPAPQLINFVEGGATPLLPLSEVDGYRIALFANASLQGAIAGTQRVLSRLKVHGTLTPDMELADWDERQRVVRKPEFDALERRYRSAGDR